MNFEKCHDTTLIELPKMNKKKNQNQNQKQSIYMEICFFVYIFVDVVAVQSPGETT